RISSRKSTTRTPCSNRSERLFFLKYSKAAMPKNILIFSDGTGQAGGISFDENRSNIYKLYRATRVGPDSKINPAEQVAFYDPGLGSKADTNAVWAKGALRWIYNLISQATG